MQAAIVHGVEAQFLNETHHFLFGCSPATGKRDAARRAGGEALVLKMIGVDVGEHLHHRSTQVLLHASMALLGHD